MALINFDCPECGHNLEVDERGAGFIVKCPECGNPLQIPDLPTTRRWLRWLPLGIVLLALLSQFAATAWFARRTRDLKQLLADNQQAFIEFQEGAQAVAMLQDAEIEQLKREIPKARQEVSDTLANAALDAIEAAEALAAELEQTHRQLLEGSTTARTAFLREHMSQVVESAKNSLPAAPVLTDLGPGRGIQGRQIVFPILPGPEGQPLREQAEATGITDDKVSFRFPGGGATYSISELHPGVAFYLPVDPLLALPRKQWTAEANRIQHLRNAQRDERLAQLRQAIESLLNDE
ncbi:MAG: zinc ribbon domain-containing protein [Lentisphaerae bacterium]|jgi:hypothetical protein|nr:zinc ribbon domain-containing protein [Lentisphaerota bacterium]